jgi:hypothetical protein
MIIDWYFRVGRILAWIFGITLFLGLWAYCIFAYGFLFGVGLGWLPAGITAGVAGLLTVPLWGILVAAILALAAYFNNDIQAMLTFIAILGGIFYGIVQVNELISRARYKAARKWLQSRPLLVVLVCGTAAVWAAFLLDFGPKEVLGPVLFVLILFGVVMFVQWGSRPRSPRS